MSQGTGSTDFIPNSFTSALVRNTVRERLAHEIGLTVVRDQAIAGFAGAQTFNLFTITGAVEVKSLWGEFTSVTNVVTVTTFSWDVNDTAITVALTQAAPGVNLSGATLRSVIIKDSVAANAATFLMSNQVRLNEIAGGHQELQGFVVSADNVTATTLRCNVTTDINTNCAIRFYVCYNALTSNGSLT